MEEGHVTCRLIPDGYAIFVEISRGGSAIFVLQIRVTSSPSITGRAGLCRITASKLQLDRSLHEAFIRPGNMEEGHVTIRLIPDGDAIFVEISRGGGGQDSAGSLIHLNTETNNIYSDRINSIPEHRDRDNIYSDRINSIPEHRDRNNIYSDRINSIPEHRDRDNIYSDRINSIPEHRDRDNIYSDRINSIPEHRDRDNIYSDRINSIPEHRDNIYSDRINSIPEHRDKQHLL
ncbi:hypothetical protein F7725_005071 [Dissostichus mawsoni]|uniref:Uncharacterized protein n=1 Tax=Dissostichus mawsoni TaxID=36200 RepID=A0A7J5XLZ5_DISMA|nr:hypothetical protein F7725_005071 [Dissostichus mawsoni]